MVARFVFPCCHHQVILQRCHVHDTILGPVSSYAEMLPHLSCIDVLSD